VTNKQDVTLWSPFPENLETIERTHENQQYLPGCQLPANLHVEKEINIAIQSADLVILAIPSQYLRNVLTQITPSLVGNRIFVNVAKGIEMSTLMRPAQIVQDVLGQVSYATISGPSHAEEVIKQQPTAVVAASVDPSIAEKIQHLFFNESFRVYSSTDVSGVELGGALKNIFAIAAGISDGLGAGDNAKAALITRGIAELSRLGHALGGKPETFAGLSGVGDMIVTCTSQHSRNRHVGEELGRGKELETIEKEMGRVVAEGVKTASGAYRLAAQKGVAVPIITEVYETIYENKPASRSVHDLMTRPPKSED
jgi:glycerol-3-phosphate dehydrogenase (NAD(P)+)